MDVCRVLIDDDGARPAILAHLIDSILKSGNFITYSGHQVVHSLFYLPLVHADGAHGLVDTVSRLRAFEALRYIFDGRQTRTM